MRYARIQTAAGPLYVIVELCEGVLWATRPMLPPEEDIAGRAFLAPQFEPVRLSELRLLPPVTPSKIICIGRNYRDHAAELGNDVPTEPLLFLKPPSSLLAPSGTILIPAISKRVDYEGELGLVIGKRCHHMGNSEDVRAYLRGYVCANDVTARDLQKSDGQWTRGKGFDTFCPVGPIVSDEIDPVGGEPVLVTTRLNGEVKQSGSTADLIFPIAHLLRYLSAVMTLEPGDLILTGTPAGVGPAAPGDRVEIEISGVGSLENRYASE